MRTFATRQPAKDAAKQGQHGSRLRSPWAMSGKGWSDFSTSSADVPALQRKCACGGGCPRCTDEGRVQRQAIASQDTSEVPPIVHEELGSPGYPLDLATRTFMESRFRHDFSQVRIHTDAQAAASARAVHARAFTMGPDIVFGAGEFAPGQETGQHLLAHELTHVLQQTAPEQTQGSVTQLPRQIQRAPLEGCTDPQTQTIDAAIAQALQGLDTAIEILNQKPLSSKAQSAMWLTFRDTEALKAAVVREHLLIIKDRLPREVIECEQTNEYGSTCRDDADAYRSDWDLKIHLCMGNWDLQDRERSRARTLVHEVAHHFFKGDPAYFSDWCEETDETKALSVGERFLNADSYACLAYLLGIRYLLREYRGETLEGIRQTPEGAIALNDAEDSSPVFYIKFEGVEQVAIEGKIPGAEYRWQVVDAIGNSYPISFEPGQEGQYTSKSSARILIKTRQQLKAAGFPSAMIQCEVKLPGAEVDRVFVLQLPISLSVTESGQKAIVAQIPFETSSIYPDDAAMEALTLQLVGYQDQLNRGEYHLDFDGHASRDGDDSANQVLSEQRAQVAKGQLEILLGKVLGNPGFKLDPTQMTVEGHGEERAREAGKTENDNSQSDRVVDVVFEVR